ncbi:MAG: response regulator [Verrucomicrobia bacterium]|nr:response regulator [Verrucomicrobiota bacterium]
MAKLVVLTQELAGLSHELGAGWTTIGRAEGNTFKIADESVSGQHCEVQARGDELAVRDLCSTNGTFVRGQRVTEAVLQVGQTLRVGEIELRFDASAVGLPPVAPFVNTMLVGVTVREPAPAVVPQPEETPKSKETSESEETPAKQYHVLFVDDSLAFVETFSELCSVWANQTWEIHSATTADQALAELQQGSMDLVVLDIGMPMVDGIQLLGIIKRRYPSVRIAVLTGKATESNRESCLAGGAELFVEKPVSADGSKVVFNLFQELMAWENREGFSGALHQVGLQEVIQMECIGRRSLILEIRNQQTVGEIYIETGAIIHVAIGDLIGVKAFNRLLSLPGGEFRLKPFQAPAQRTVEQPWEYLIMEAARCRDEETELLAKNAIETPPEVSAPKPPPATEQETTCPDDEFVVVATYDGTWNQVEADKD